jgi:hypothetical protein
LNTLSVDFFGLMVYLATTPGTTIAYKKACQTFEPYVSLRDRSVGFLGLVHIFSTHFYWSLDDEAVYPFPSFAHILGVHHGCWDGAQRHLHGRSGARKSLAHCHDGS